MRSNAILPPRIWAWPVQGEKEGRDREYRIDMRCRLDRRYRGDKKVNLDRRWVSRNVQRGQRGTWWTGSYNVIRAV